MLRPFTQLYVQVLVAIALGVAVGALWPSVGVALQPLGLAFVNLIKMVIAPVIFVSVAGGVARMSDLKRLGGLGVKTLVYFEVVSTAALVVGLIVGETIQPGRGFNIDPRALDPSIAASYLDQSRHGQNVVDYLLHLIPSSFFSPFAGGDILQVLLVAILTGLACANSGPLGERAAQVFETIGQVFFAIIRIVTRAAPIGAFGAMGFTIGKYGLAALVKLGALVATFYLTAALFVFVVLGLIAAATGFSIVRFLSYIRDELLIVLGTSSSEAALPQLMDKLQRLGAGKSVTGLVVPVGYSFNLDGTNIYMTLATLFLAQATNTPLSLIQELTLLAVAMLTSKGASGVAGAGFITLAATLATVPTVPIAALAVLVGVDRFMSECRALTNLVGNGVATLVIARWEGELDRDALNRELHAKPGLAPAAAIVEASGD